MNRLEAEEEEKEEEDRTKNQATHSSVGLERSLIDIHRSGEKKGRLGRPWRGYILCSQLLSYINI